MVFFNAQGNQYQTAIRLKPIQTLVAYASRPECDGKLSYQWAKQGYISIDWLDFKKWAGANPKTTTLIYFKSALKAHYIYRTVDGQVCINPAVIYHQNANFEAWDKETFTRLADISDGRRKTIRSEVKKQKKRMGEQAVQIEALQTESKNQQLEIVRISNENKDLRKTIAKQNDRISTLEARIDAQDRRLSEMEALLQKELFEKESLRKTLIKKLQDYVDVQTVEAHFGKKLKDFTITEVVSAMP